MEKARGEPWAPFISGAAWNLPSARVPPSGQRCWFTSHRWGAKGRHSCHASHGPTKPSMVCRPWQQPSLPSSLPASLLQSLGTNQHPGITSAPRSCEGGLLGWASSFPQQMNLMGRMCLQNTLSLIHPLWSSQKTLPEDLTFPCLP